MTLRSTAVGVAVLVALAAVATLLLTVVSDSTRQVRADNQQIYATRLLSDVLPQQDFDSAPGLQQISVTDAELLGTADPLLAYPVYQSGRLSHVVVTVIAPDGYVAPIKLLVGISSDGQVSGVRVAAHRETPGLGDQIDATRSDWITLFRGRGLTTEPDDWELQRDGGTIDHISGATVTSRAVVNAVRNALVWFSANRDTLPLTAPPVEGEQ